MDASHLRAPSRPGAPTRCPAVGSCVAPAVLKQMPSKMALDCEKYALLVRGPLHSFDREIVYQGKCHLPSSGVALDYEKYAFDVYFSQSSAVFGALRLKSMSFVRECGASYVVFGPGRLGLVDASRCQVCVLFLFQVHWKALTEGIEMPKTSETLKKSIDASMVLVVLSMASAWSIDAAAPIGGYGTFIRFDYLLLGSCCCVAALAPDLVRWIGGSARPWGLMALGLAGIALTALSLWNLPVITEAASLCTAMFQTIVLLRCFSQLSQLKMAAVLLWLALWLCATGALVVGVALLPSAFHQLVANGLEMAIIVLFLVAPSSGDMMSDGKREELMEEGAPKSFLPLGLYVVQFAVLFVIKACGVIASSHFVLASGLGFAVAALTVVALSVAGGKVIKLKGLYNLALLFAELALVTTSVGAVAYGGAGFLNGVAYAFFAVFCFAVYCTICLRHGLDAVRIFAIAIACECFASMAGIQFCVFARDEGMHSGTILVVLSALLAVTFLFLFSDAQYRSDWGTKRSCPTADSVIKYYYTLPDVCTALAKQHGLSKREETVLQLLAQKKTAPDIATELFISIPTVKTHTQNIYRKFDIHSRAELFALLDAENDRL